MKTEYSYPALGISIHIHKLESKLSGMNIPDMFCHDIKKDLLNLIQQIKLAILCK